MSDQSKHFHEIRDPIHVFVRITSDERKLIDTWAFQRLRYIHQLATTFFVYPGATHRRFEHSLGVMELAARVFDVVMADPHEAVKKQLGEVTDKEALAYWRKVVRLAALCHDLGHLPFSHAAEAELLPPGWNHERLTAEIVKSPRLVSVWKTMTPKPDPEDIAKIALGPEKAADAGLTLSLWETVLSEIIVGDAFGVDRMDYLLRDSLHAGVVYGHFDHYRILDSIRLLPSPRTEEGQDINQLAPTLGITEGGLHSADAMLLARYFMFSQLYFHPIRRIYDIHLKDFLLQWIGQFPTDVDHLLAITDNEVLAAMQKAAMNPSEKGHDPAKRLINHTHFKVVYRRRKKDVDVNPEAARLVFNAATAKFGAEKLRYDKPRKAMALSGEFPVLTNTQEIVSSRSMSEALPQVPAIIAEFVYAERESADEVARWIDNNIKTIIQNKLHDDEEEPKDGAK